MMTFHEILFAVAALTSATFMIRRSLSLIALYQEMAESHLASEAFDTELVKRMLATRESVLLLIEASMPLPLSTAELDDVRTESRAVH